MARNINNTMHHRRVLQGALVLVAALCLGSYAEQESIYDKLIKSPGLKERLGWKIAFCQHPMYLVIDEDRGEPPVGERVPPWGAATAADYVKRVERNLDSLEKFEQLKVNYQFSGVAMRSIADRFPAVVERMKRMYERGSLDFIGGTYSQAHLHTLGAESNWRQLEYGLEVFEELFGKKIKLYARQETGLHQQIPQMLRHFGYDYLAVPCFWWAMEITEGPFEMAGNTKGIRTVAGDEFIDAVSLDGSTIPAYLYTHVGGAEPKQEMAKGLFASSRIWINFPDMREVGQHTIDKYCPVFDIVLLENAIRKRYAEVPPRAKARLYSHWSYTEGVWAEELLRANKLAEEAAVLAESICCMGRLAGVPVDKADALKSIWQTILKYQHHDVHWIEVTDLRRKAVNRLAEAVDKSHNITAEVAGQLVAENRQYTTLFNGYPQKRRCLVELTGSRAFASKPALQKFDDRFFGFVNLPAGGFKSFRVSAEAHGQSKKTALPERIKTKHYGIEFSQDGLIRQISVGNKNLLKTDEFLGGQIKALISDKWVDNRSADCRFFSGDVGYVLERSVNLGGIPIKERYFFFRNEPLIKVEVEFDFNGNEVGYFWFDDTKINIYYPTVGGEIYHDIPFGCVQARELRPLFAPNWLYCGGLAYVNRGTVKHWVKDGVIANVIAWGGNRFNNRTHWGWTDRTQYDIRLYGKQKIEYFLIPCGKFDANEIVRQVDALTWPVLVTSGKGEKSLYRLDSEDLVTTSVFQKDDEVWARGYKLPSSAKSEYRNWQIFNKRLTRIE